MNAASIITIIQILMTTQFVYMLENDLAKTPPMGWISWERFKCQIDCHKSNNKNVKCINEKLFTQMADAMVDRGYLRAGYNRINIDDCWSKKSRELNDGRLLPDSDRFPNGIDYLAKYMHDRGLKLGIYQNLGRRTCMGYPGILGHMEKDIETFVEWNIDMIKLDACFNVQTSQLDNGYLKFRKLIDQSTKKPILISCSWPYYQLFASRIHIIPKWDLISMNCNMFRVFHDITPDWNIIQKIIDFMGDNQAIFRRVTGAGSWPDPDMLMIGNPGLSISQAESQMAIWCMLPAPLFMSNDLLDIHPDFERILLNSNAIAINQDKLAVPGERIFHNETIDLWRRSLSDGQMAIAILNRNNDNHHNYDVHASILLEQIQNDQFKMIKTFNVLNVFSNETYQLKRSDITNETFINVTIEPNGVVFLKLIPNL